MIYRHKLSGKREIEKIKVILSVLRFYSRLLSPNEYELESYRFLKLLYKAEQNNYVYRLISLQLCTDAREHSQAWEPSSLTTLHLNLMRQIRLPNRIWKLSNEGITCSQLKIDAENGEYLAPITLANGS
jgi:hypothetical protein